MREIFSLRNKVLIDHLPSLRTCTAGLASVTLSLLLLASSSAYALPINPDTDTFGGTCQVRYTTPHCFFRMSDGGWEFWPACGIAAKKGKTKKVNDGGRSCTCNITVSAGTIPTITCR